MGNNNKLGVITSKFVYVHTSVEIEFMTTTSLARAKRGPQGLCHVRKNKNSNMHFPTNPVLKLKP